MLFKYVVMNPPYSGNLHLQILKKTSSKRTQNGELVCIHPARWIQDPLWDKKQNSDHEKFQESIINKITDIDIYCGNLANGSFDIFNGTDLCITYISSNPGNWNIFNDLSKSIINKILPFAIKSCVKEHIDENSLDGFRCEVKEMLPISNISGRTDRTVKQKCVEFVIDKSREAVFNNGYDLQGKFWTETRGSGGIGEIKKVGDPLSLSIKFNTLEEACNFRDSCRTNFFKNWIYLIKFDMHTPLFAIPFMSDYQSKWDDERFCQFFKLDNAETKYMSKKRDDYRVKDFIKYRLI